MKEEEISNIENIVVVSFEVYEEEKEERNILNYSIGTLVNKVNSASKYNWYLIILNKMVKK